MSRRGPDSPLQLLWGSIGSRSPSYHGLPSRAEHEARREEEATALRRSIWESSPTATARASSSGEEPGSTGMSIKGTWVRLHPWVRLGLGPGDTFSLHSSLGRHPPQHPLGPQPPAVAAVKGSHSHPVRRMCPWLRMKSPRRAEDRGFQLWLRHLLAVTVWVD